MTRHVLDTGVDKASMSVSVAAPTVLTTPGQWYDVAGTFVDGYCKNFSLASDGLFTYNGYDGRIFLINGVSDLEVDKACEIYYSLEVNGTPQSTIMTPHTFAASSKIENISITRFAMLNNGDQFRVVTKSDTASTTLTAHTLFLTILGQQ